MRDATYPLEPDPVIEADKKGVDDRPKPAIASRLRGAGARPARIPARAAGAEAGRGHPWRRGALAMRREHGGLALDPGGRAGGTSGRFLAAEDELLERVAAGATGVLVDGHGKVGSSSQRTASPSVGPRPCQTAPRARGFELTDREEDEPQGAARGGVDPRTARALARHSRYRVRKPDSARRPMDSDRPSRHPEGWPEWRNRQTRWIQNPLPARV